MIIYEGHTRWVNSVAFSPDGESVVSGSDDKTVRIWNARRPSLLGEPLRGHDWPVYSVSYSPLGNLVASGSYDETIRLWDPSTRQQSGSILGGSNALMSVVFSPDAKLVASASGGYQSFPTGFSVQLWNVQTRNAASGALRGHTNVVNSVSFSSDGTRLVSGSSDKTIRVWDVERGTNRLGPLEGHTKLVCSTDFSPDGAQIASCSWDGTIRLWDSRTGGMVAQPYTGHGLYVCSVRFSPLGTYLASSGDDNAVRLWDIRTGRQMDRPFKEHINFVTSVAFSPCGQYIASGSEDHKVSIRKVLDKGQYPAAAADVGIQTIDSHMSTHEIFECLCRAGCMDLSSAMDSRQEPAKIMSGGGFGDIWKGKLYSGTPVAIKAWRTYALGPCEYKTLKRAARELYTWSRMDHPNIHRLQGVILFRDQYLGMVSEWMDNGNLHEYLLKHPDADRYQLCIHVASGLDYMHSRSTIHGDLKALNVLVSSDGVAKLSDFDFSVMSDASSLLFTATSNTRAGSVRWVAPEMFDEETPERTTQSDVYALGMTLLEILTGDVPYPDRRIDGAVVKAILLGTLPTRPVQHIKDDDDGNRIWELLLDCWRRTPSERPSAGRVHVVLKYGSGRT